jgi:peptide/nickel transport system substrate-binding protein
MLRLGWGAGAVSVTLAVAGCGLGSGDDPDERGPSATGGEHLVYVPAFVPRSAWAVESDDAILLSRFGCLETLIRYESDGTLRPGLAESWEQSSPTEWTFTLREGVEFQDGTPMDARAVVGAVTHVLEAPTPARSFNSDTISGVEAVDDTTVRVSTPAADVLLPYRFASPNSGILAPKAYSGRQIDIEGTCTGPFAVAKAAQQSLTMERNEKYWGGVPKLATAEVRFVLDGDARVNQLLAGEADVIEGIPPSAQARLAGEDGVEILEDTQPRTTSIMLNASRPPFDDTRVRRALQHAVDTVAIAESVFEGGAVPAGGPFASSDPWAPEEAEPVTLDQDEAKRLLAEARVEPSSLHIELIAYNDQPAFADLAAVIQDQLSQIGVEVDILTGDYASFEPDLLEGDFDAVLLSRGYLVDVGDPAGYLSSDFTCEGGYNIAHYCDSEADVMIRQASATQDAETRHALYARIGDKLQADAAAVFLVLNSGLSATQPEVKGYEMHPLNFYGLTPELSIG